MQLLRHGFFTAAFFYRLAGQREQQLQACLGCAAFYWLFHFGIGLSALGVSSALFKLPSASFIFALLLNLWLFFLLRAGFWRCGVWICATRNLTLIKRRIIGG